MRIGSILSIVTIGFLLVSTALAQQGKAPAKVSMASQRYQDHFDIRVTGVRVAQEWKVFGNIPGSPVYKADPGLVLVIVEFEVRDVRTGKEDNGDVWLKDFEVEDQQAHRYKSRLESTDLREVPFAVPDPGSLKVFRVAALTFDIQSLVKKLKP